MSVKLLYIVPAVGQFCNHFEAKNNKNIPCVMTRKNSHILAVTVMKNPSENFCCLLNPAVVVSACERQADLPGHYGSHTRPQVADRGTPSRSGTRG